MSPVKPAPKKGRSAIADVVAREYTIHLHKRVRLVFLLVYRRAGNISGGRGLSGNGYYQ